jgi:hypothetical protein
MKIISKQEYDIIKINKMLSNRLEKIQEEYYQEIISVLGCKDDNGWLVDYFFNDNVDIDKLVEMLDVEIKD